MRFRRNRKVSGKNAFRFRGSWVERLVVNKAIELPCRGFCGGLKGSPEAHSAKPVASDGNEQVVSAINVPKLWSVMLENFSFTVISFVNRGIKKMCMRI